ncbi:HAD domain-containing protein [Paucibacter sp. JuS9]|uniref:HAD domain-containing protein n=1 Tax=Paucibacter sp. JuS9 TaxID=3228748 RepID=UPI003757669A
MIVFLDIDGVLHPVGASVDRFFEHDKLLASWLREQPCIQLVISSSWRETHGLDELREMLFHFEPNLKARVIGVTPMSMGSGVDAERSSECKAWLMDNGHEQSAWIALDDDQDLFDQAVRRDHLVLCDQATGLDRARLSLAWQKLRRQQRERSQPSQRRRYRSANPPIHEISVEEEAEIVATIDRARQAEAAAAGDAVAAAAARREQWRALPADQRWAATVFLDIDEVLCVDQPFAASSLHKAFADGLVPEPEFFDALFSRAAREALENVHDQFHGRVRYVISSSWREHFTRAQIELVLRKTGFDFVADGLHPGPAWRCYQAAFTGDRQMDIESWLEHFHCGEPFVVLDDKHSGGPLRFHRHFVLGEVLYGRVVLCQPGVGLTMDHVGEIFVALGRPA